ncbi:hypothetical protein [Streptomyces aurantiogriseus]
MAGVDLATLRAGPRVCSAVALGGERLALSRLSMHLFGKANRWLPAWLDRRMPHLPVDPPDEPLPAPSPDSPTPEPEPSTRP